MFLRRTDSYRVNFMAKTSLNVFSLIQEQVWSFSVLGYRIYEMRCLFVVVGPNALFIVLPQLRGDGIRDYKKIYFSIPLKSKLL